MPGRLENARRGRVLSNSLLRLAARAIVHLQPQRLGQVSEAWEGVFRLRPYGLQLRYELGPKDTIGNILLWCGYRTFERETLPAFVQMARTARGVLDIGANTGLYSMIACAANPQARVIAWEPVPYLYDKCVANLRLNGFESRCEVRRTAISNTSGSAELYVPEETTTASLNPAHKSGESSPMQVRIETGDESIPADFPVDLVKLDVETHEYEALCGLRQTLKKWRPSVIFECLPTVDSRPIEELFRGLGYRFHRLSRSGPQPVDRIDPAETLDQNFLAVAR